jgi:hypothetical protein
MSLAGTAATCRTLPDTTMRPFALLPLVLSGTFSIGGLLAQRVAEIEPNDTPAQAQALTAGMHVTANLVAGEQDWFQFTLAAAGQVHVRTSGNFNVNPAVDTWVGIYDAAAAVRLAFDDNSDGTHSDCGVTLAAGSYTALVMGKLATTTGDYGLDFVVLPLEPIDASEAAEPNGNPSGGGAPSPLNLGDTVDGELSVSTDVDWWAFTLTAPAIVQAVCHDDGGVPQLDQTRLQFYQETSPGIWTPIGTVGQNAASHRAFNLAHVGMLAAGNYAIEVSSATATAAGTAPWNYTKTGRYALRTRRIDLPGTVTVAEAPEPNNTPLSAAPMTLGDDAAGNISGSNEGDWYAVVLGGPTTIGAMCETGPAPGCTGTTLRLYDSNGTVIATASGGALTHGRLITTAREAGVYYLEVAGAVVASSGNYVLNTGGVDAMFVPSSVTVQPPSVNACPGSNGLRPNLGNASGEKPFLGSTYVLRLSNAVANTIVVGMVGLSDTVAGGSLPLPFDLGPLGAPGCFVRVDPLITPGFLADANGVAVIDFPLVPNLAARGLAVFVQCLCFDPFLAGNTLQLTVSNDLRLIAGDRSF